MSLKAKIEAVIYASEEPVTLNQLVGLLGHEAQAELDREAANQLSLSLNETELDLEDAAASDPTLNPEASEDVGDPDPEALNDEIIPPDSEADPEPSLPEEAAGEPADPSPAETPATEQGTEAPPETPEELASTAAKAEKEKARRLREHFRTILETLIADYASNDRGIEIREVAGGYRLATKPEYHDAVRGFVKSLKPPLKLSLQALETLAVVAYKQPVTAPEISEIRGVDTSGVLGSLIARKLITTAGRKQVIGRPILYKTTRDFLLRFGLKDTSELPSIEEFEKMAGELADADPIQEEIPMPGQEPNTSHELQADGSPALADNPLDITVDDALAHNPLARTSVESADDNPLTDDFSDITPRPATTGQEDIPKNAHEDIKEDV